MKITEEFLYFIWQNRLFDQNGLNAGGEPLKILNPGTRNTFSGPDFSFSKIKLGNTTWIGNVEIHVKTSDWFKHGHDNDDAFKNVILHVVYEDDLPEDKKLPKPLALKPIILNNVINNFNEIQNSKNWLPCSSLFQNREEIKTNLWLERVCISRLERKVLEVEEIYNSVNNDLEQTFFIMIGKAMGQKANAQAFEFLTRNTPLFTILKYADKPEMVEALLMGQAGFLEEVLDDYQDQQKSEFEFLAYKHNLKPMSISIWKKGSVRPSNQPTLRLAQFSRLIIKLFPFAEKSEKLDLVEIEKKLKVATSTYWETHFVFGKESKNQKKVLGKSAINLLLINAIVPYIFFLGKKKQDDELKEKALTFLDAIKAESNSIINKWAEFGLNPNSALFSQALIEQHNMFCKKFACLTCGIGNQIISRK